MNNGEQVLAGFWELLQKKMVLENFFIKSKLKGYNPSELHCIQYIHENPDSNVTKLADAFRMTTGGITKLTKKLIKKGLVDTYRSSSNKKEIYFCLTDLGREIYTIHQEFHKGFNQRDRIIFEQITEQEYAGIFRFLETYGAHLDCELQKVGIDSKSDIGDRF